MLNRGIFSVHQQPNKNGAGFGFTLNVVTPGKSLIAAILRRETYWKLITKNLQNAVYQLPVPVTITNY
jgi:hypothetical protein